MKWTLKEHKKNRIYEDENGRHKTQTTYRRFKRRFPEYEYDRHEKIYKKTKNKYLINLGFDFRNSINNKKGTIIHGYIQFSSDYPATKFHKAKLQRLAFDLLAKQRKRAYNFNLSDEITEQKIEPHITLMLDEDEFYNKEIHDFKEEDYYYVE